MNSIRNSLRNKIVLFNILIVLPLSLIVYFYLPWRLKTFAVKERVKVLSPLNEQATLYLNYSLQDVSANEEEEKI